MSNVSNVLKHTLADEASFHISHEYYDHDRGIRKVDKKGFQLVLSRYHDVPIVCWQLKSSCKRLRNAENRSRILELIDLATSFTPIWDISKMPFYRDKMDHERSRQKRSSKSYMSGFRESFDGVYPIIDWRYYTTLSEDGLEATNRMPWGVLEGKFEDWCSGVVAIFKKQIDSLKANATDYWHIGSCSFATYNYEKAFNIDHAIKATDIDMTSDYLVGSHIRI